MASKAVLTVVLTGNMHFEHPISAHREKPFLDLVDMMRNWGVTFANLECAVGARDENWPIFSGGMGWSGTHMIAPPSMLEELRFLGVDAVYTANNHVGDFAEGGILATIRHLRAAGMPFAGIGASLTEASEACYVETPNGRVAMISATDWGPRRLMELPFPWPAGYMASNEMPPFRSRPGVNLLRYEAVVHVDEAAFVQLRRISAEMQWERGKVVRRRGGGRTEALYGPSLLDYEIDTDREFFFMGRKFVLDEEFRISTFAFQEDLERIFANVRIARQQADVVIVAFHDQNHARGLLDAMRELAYGSIDAGADIYLNHGGTPRGIEIYKGKVILYGQSNFHLQNEESTHIPSSMISRMGLPATSDAVDFLRARQEGTAQGVSEGGQTTGPFDELHVHTVSFDGSGRIIDVRIHPIGDAPNPGWSTRTGVPGLLVDDPVRNEDALRRVIDRCTPLGTTVEIEDGTGVIKVADAA